MYSEILKDVSTGLADLGMCHGDYPFTGNWADIKWMNTPGPIYGAATDTCGTGPLVAPNNVQLDETAQEIVFRQPVNLYEVRQVIHAAEAEPFGGYGADGDLHWTYEKIKDWWSRRRELEATINKWHTHQLNLEDRKNYQYFAAICRWKDYVENGLHDYLRAYAFFLEEHRIPVEGDKLPLL